MDTASWTGIAAIALYLGAAFPVARQLRGGAAPGRAAVLALGAPAVILHAICLWQLLVSDAGIHLGLFPALTIPAALWIDAGEAARPLAHGIGLHVLLSVLAQAVIGIAAAQSVLLLIQHRQLKDGHIRGVMRLFPPIQVMETMLFELLWAGLILLSAAVVTGFLYVDNLFAQHLVHKTVLTLIAEGVFAVLLAGHHLLGWRARIAIFMTLAGFALLVLGFFGSQLVLEYILHRA